MNYKLEDVAKLANVSKTTVSRVINNRGFLSQKTINNVRSAMKELNYQPIVVARQLYNKKTEIVGLLFPTTANPFFGELTESLESKLYSDGYKVLLGNSMNNSIKEANYLNQLLSKQVDGLIVGTHNQDVEEYKYKDLPIVAIDRIVNEDIPTIGSDNYQGGIIATERLILKGAKNIIHTNGIISLETPAKQRRVAYEEIMLKNNLKPKTIIVNFSDSYDGKKRIFEKMFSGYSNVEAVFASNDIDAVLIMQVAKEKGLKIPDDLMVIGYDGTRMIQNILPELTTIIQPIEEIANLSIEVLKKRMNNHRTDIDYKLPVLLKEGLTG